MCIDQHAEPAEFVPAVDLALTSSVDVPRRTDALRPSRLGSSDRRGTESGSYPSEINFA
jgi:hypothetical protein